MVPHAEDVKVFQAVLQDIDELVVAVRVGRHHEEAMLENEVATVADDALDDLVVLKANPDPQSRDEGSVLVESAGRDVSDHHRRS